MWGYRQRQEFYGKALAYFVIAMAIYYALYYLYHLIF